MLGIKGDDVAEEDVGDGVAALLQAAKDGGILGLGTDFTGGAMPMGAAAARLQIVVDGVTHDLVGDPNAALPCPPTQACPAAVPGTPAAFARFWYQLLDMAGWLGPELGPEQPYVPASYAVIVGPPPEPWAGATPVVWPVADPLPDAFGAPVRGEPGTRCGIAAGDVATSLRPPFEGATQLTPFVATVSAIYGLGDPQAYLAMVLHLQRGDRIGLLGANGTGKTTLLKSIAGFLKPTAGSITFNDSDLIGRMSYDIAKMGLN